MNDVVRIPSSALEGPTHPPLAALLSEHLAVQIERLLSEDECSRFVRGVYQSREGWVADFDSQQFTLGMAWYTHLEQGKTRDYFAGAGEANQRVERFAPGLQARIRDLAGRIVGEPVRPRPGWCGPGVHIFPPGAEVSRAGGTVHYDLEGLPPALVESHAPALSLVGMLQPAESGGGLRLWDDLHRARGDEAAGADLPDPAVVAHYGPGDLLLFDSYRLHQIEPFTGQRDRVSVTAHLAYGPGGWEIWF